MSRVYDDLILHITPDKFFIESLSEQQLLLVIDRINHDISLQPNQKQIPPVASRKPFHGILGVINLISGPYLIIVTRKVRQGTVCGGEVWRILETEIISFSRAEHHLTPTQLEANRKYTAMMQQVLSTPYFYFSYTYDISHSRQRLDTLGSREFYQKSLFERSDSRFVWNKHLLQPFLSNPKLHCYALPVIHGFVSINSCSISGHRFIWSIISRRSTERVGTRLFVRGADENGFVANYVETEQIVEVGTDIASYIHTRGSIPLFWQQRPNLKYKPPPTLEPHQPHAEAFNKHFQAQVPLYGQQVIVNLIDQKKSEGRLETSLKMIHKQVNNKDVYYEAFDFHKECSKMRWDRLSILMDRLAQYEEQFQYFHSRNGTPLLRQTGVFRTNCIDCLDRTNVVQSMLARRNLQAILVRLGVLPDNARIENQISVEQLFKTVWADHADMISIQYTGTGALKTDFTRTGQRTKMGLLEDGRRSAIRYFKNNFADGFRQDSMDLFVGNHVVSPTEGVTKESPVLQERKDTRYLALPIAFALSLAMLALSLTLPAQYSTEILLSILFWTAMLGVSIHTLLKNGPDYVDQPKLIHLSRHQSSSLHSA
ncbi:phosphatidylinositide phosphatase SAC1 [Eurytemora carolleeae]|uniref:phosphatidylinositide phosphatase SAC1 n=1 Tax=Eurytemora carolleeae TaxID=1294199 RepID=UPI000C779A25|nr:phosphatidylinositide phosphatase SAC1 [Eurytemora carolleeae]XP_023337817.1 phosphatidylinositide phosphatase SAC1 [Eurytemora carolleeae]|eukprot:XP_023337807.1 phosphatidylinositide phosphatase SAC1-like [Eurytemora affinis]